MREVSILHKLLSEHEMSKPWISFRRAEKIMGFLKLHDLIVPHSFDSLITTTLMMTLSAIGKKGGRVCD